MNSHLKHLASVLLTGCLLLGATGPAQAQTRKRTKPAPAVRALSPREIAARIYPAVVSIFTLTNGEEVYTGTGFFVTPTRIVTCYHVIANARVVLVKLHGTRSPMDSADGAIAASIHRTYRDKDLALLAIEGASGKPLKLFTGSDLYVGEPIYTVGDPKGMSGTFSNGMLSNFIKYEDGTLAIQFTAPISPGSSGGPLVTDKAEVIGIVNEQLREGQNLNFAVPVNYLRALMEGRTADESESYIDNNMEPPAQRKRKPKN